MKTAVIFYENTKQIIFTPENEQEKFALSLLTSDDNIELLLKTGSFGENHNKPFTASVSHCKGGYLRIYNDEDSRILVLRPKEK